jgi:predicted RNA-binding Zn-ribbon protein involved in translation (DUF1610 family)
MIDEVKIKIHCEGCKSESILAHEMEENYTIHHCPFCGKDIDQEYECEEVFEDELG